MGAIRLVVGLGNIGREYERTRHNAGFWFVDALAHSAGARFANESKFFGMLARATIDARPVWLLKPSTFMNRSGQSVAALAAFYRIGIDEILVAHDDLDLPAGSVKLKFGGGNAGQNGLRDIQARCGGADFWRLRIGIDHPRTLGLAQQVADYVLHPPSTSQFELMRAAIERALPIVCDALGGAFDDALKRLHTRERPADG